MNESGRALGGLRAETPGAQLPDLLVLVDDFALPTGTFRIRGGGSAGGHNGLKSVEERLGTQQYARLRIGVGPLPRGLDGWRDYVLEPPADDEREAIVALLPTLCEAVECWMAQGAERAMAQFNRRLKTGEPDDAEPA
jgi:PTH1 family peptidyl-tRNA hydrolase